MIALKREFACEILFQQPHILGNLTKDDIDFMMQWIKRLDLKGSKQPEQLSFIEKESEIKDEKEPDVPF